MFTKEKNKLITMCIECKEKKEEKNFCANILNVLLPFVSVSNLQSILYIRNAYKNIILSVNI